MMEKDRPLDRLPIPRDPIAVTPEELALQALVNKLFTNSDAAVCRIFSRIWEDIHE